MQLPDIYFEPFWGELNSQLEEGEYKIFEYESELGIGYYHFIKRKAPFMVNGVNYYDTITPYGFNGPIILECENGQRKKIINQFNNAFEDYCKEERIIAEYIRFSPWLKNHEDFKYIYELKYNNYTLGIDLIKDFFNEEFSSKCRNQTRKAMKSGVEIQYDFIGESMDEFYRLYKLMADKNSISENYRFSKEYFQDTFTKCNKHVFFINAIYDNDIISSSMFLESGEYLHYHFSANDVKYGSLCANNLILFTAATWGKENDKKQLHLGGAFNEGLFKFKRSFTKSGVFDYYVGTKIRDPKVYKELVEKSKKENLEFFPAYR